MLPLKPNGQKKNMVAHDQIPPDLAISQRVAQGSLPAESSQKSLAKSMVTGIHQIIILSLVGTI
jgi:hypothetical protein